MPCPAVLCEQSRFVFRGSCPDHANLVVQMPSLTLSRRKVPKALTGAGPMDGTPTIVEAPPPPTDFYGGPFRPASRGMLRRLSSQARERHRAALRFWAERRIAQPMAARVQPWAWTAEKTDRLRQAFLCHTHELRRGRPRHFPLTAWHISHRPDDRDRLRRLILRGKRQPDVQVSFADHTLCLLGTNSVKLLGRSNAEAVESTDSDDEEAPENDEGQASSWAHSTSLPSPPPPPSPSPPSKVLDDLLWGCVPLPPLPPQGPTPEGIIPWDIRALCESDRKRRRATC